MVLVRKAVKQDFSPSPPVSLMMELFRQMTNECIRIGLNGNISTLKRLSAVSYHQLQRYERVPSYYRLCAISMAVGILSSRKKSLRRGFTTKNPYVAKPLIACCYGFRISGDRLIIPIADRKHESVILNSHTMNVISSQGLAIRSFTMTEKSLSLCISKEVEAKDPNTVVGAVGVDRNLRNIAAGNESRVTCYDISKIVEIGDSTRSIIGSFKRNDSRVRQRLASKYGARRTSRVSQILHRVSKDVVQGAKRNNYTIVFEEIRGIRKLYRRGSGKGRAFRGRMNSAPFGEIKRQVEYKASWEGASVVTLTTSETRGTSFSCPKCGERLQSAAKGDLLRQRQVWCAVCKKWRDRDVVAALNISRRGWVRFAHSEGEAVEAVKGNPEREGEPVILRVDASKPGKRD